ncbi:MULTISPECIES: DMT family transporter [unclassified Bradyrhizobium]|uniref:DMT family transporter n=1 Tax=unclassified Bradyrhizobium TaxID=2631580 RepID=UPI00247994B1|nr:MULTISPECIES: DMT family transporter [unclassified Bradyrhizobium]WGS18615.1 DMT family transporter [Bradyrhizobium sp. ISRA463]WGS25437.1 DMT family transporter [Bradyrhizobium sp. ISRA464]
MNQSLSPAKAAALFVVVVLGWGINWSVTKSLVVEIPPLWTAAIRSWIALIGLLAILRATGNLIIPRMADVPVVLSVALLHMTLFSTLAAAGLRYLPASKGVVLGYTTPLWVALAASVAGTERLGMLKLVGVAAGLLGLCVILNPASLDWGNLHVIVGAGMIILAAICWAANIIYIRSHRWIATPLQLLLWQVLVATVVLSTMALATEGVPRVTWSPHLALLFLYSGFIGTALAYWAMSMVNKSLPALTTSLGTTATPIIGIVSAALLLGEPVDLSLALAAALIVGGIALSTLADAPSRA